MKDDAHTLTLNSPSETLEAVLAGARMAQPLVPLDDGRTFILTPPGFSAQNVTDPHLLPPRIKQSVTLDTRAALSAYINRFVDDRSVIVADIDAGKIHGLLDYHKASGTMMALEPMAVSHRATLHLRDSEEFKRWNAIEGKMLDQVEFAAFLEENAEDISEPDPTVMIEVSRDLEATQGVTFKASTRLENGDRAFTYETETKTKGDIRVPREFRLSIPLYQGEEPVALRCAFRWRVSGGGLVLGFEWRRVEYMRQAFFQQIATQVAEDTGCPVYFGRLA